MKEIPGLPPSRRRTDAYDRRNHIALTHLRTGDPAEDVPGRWTATARAPEESAVTLAARTTTRRALSTHRCVPAIPPQRDDPAHYSVPSCSRGRPKRPSRLLEAEPFHLPLVQEWTRTIPPSTVVELSSVLR